jgi:hypothetical protein
MYFVSACPKPPMSLLEKSKVLRGCSALTAWLAGQGNAEFGGYETDAVLLRTNKRECGNVLTGTLLSVMDDWPSKWLQGCELNVLFA